MLLFRIIRITSLSSAIFVLIGPMRLWWWRALLFLPLMPIVIVLQLVAKCKNISVLLLTVHILGGVFVKLGQMLSTRPDLVGYDNAVALRQLQDKMPSMSGKKVRKVLELYLRMQIKEAFCTFEDEAVASASIAQVHRATLHDGTSVAVKVMRHGIAGQILQDIAILRLFCRMINILGYMKNYGMMEIVNELERGMLRELDFGMEAATMEEFCIQVASNVDYVVIPSVYWRYCRSGVMVSDWVNGIAFSDVESIERLSACERKMVAEKLLNFFLYQVYECGFFHADPHHGNMFLMHDSKIAFVDFGSAARLDSKDKHYITMILYGFIKKDYQRIAQIHRDAGYINDAVDLNELATSCRIVGESFIGIANQDIKVGAMLQELFRVVQRFGIKIQPQLVLLQKTLIMMEGVLVYLDPSINTWAITEPWLELWMLRNFGWRHNVFYKIRNVVDKFWDMCGQSAQNVGMLNDIKNIIRDTWYIKM